MSPCPRGIDTGAYVLGALEPQEHEAFAEHLRSCDHCRREVAELRVAAEALPLTAEPLDPPDALRSRIMEVVRADADERAHAQGEQRRGARARARVRGSRLRGLRLAPAPLAIAACALLALGVAIGLLAGGGGESKGGERAVQALVAVPGAHGTLVVGAGGGARLQVRGLPAPPAGRVYQVWRQMPGGGTPQPTDALFSPSRDGTATVSVPGGVKGVQRVLVSDEPRGGSRAPTGRVVLTASPA
jgi:anti-sigma-K factor RskA